MHDPACISISIVEIPPTTSYPSTEDGRRIFRARICVGKDGADHTLTITCPHTPEQEQRLRWYFEAHVDRPYTDQIRAQDATASVMTYGHSLFQQVFAADPEIGRELQPLLSQPQNLRIEIEGSPAFHALHWEALCEPGHPPLALQAQLLRRSTRQANPVRFHDSPQLRVLLVTARAQDAGEAAYRTISRPLLDALGDGVQVRVDLLRPGRYSALEDLLRRTSTEHGPGYFHVIHFDLHGSVSRPRDIAEMPYLQSTELEGRGVAVDSLQGYLYFEPEIEVPADQGVAQRLYRAVDAMTLTGLLGAHGIPMVLLNACQSAMQVGDSETSLGAQLLEAGVQVVIAMSYRVLVESATQFVRCFYQRLFENAPVTEAMRDARRALFSDSRRCGRFGIPIQLEDWMLPVMYQSRELHLPLRQPTADETATVQRTATSAFLEPTTEYGFFGRDLDVLAIERGLLRHNLLLVRGMGGAGKSTLLRHLGHWWQRTGWIREVFEFSYDERCWTRQQMLDVIARRLLTAAEYDRFIPLPTAQQQAKMVGLLRAQPHLLLLDNLETITGSHLAVGQSLSESERKDLEQFLSQLRDGSSLVLLGSRAGEDWLSPGTFESNIHELQGLDPSARALMACAILRRIGQESLLDAAAASGPEVPSVLDALQRLLKLLGGFPLAMEVVLPALASESLEDVLAALERGDVDLDRGDSEDKTRSIVRCIDYAYGRLDAGAQRLLTCLAPFTGVFNTMVQDKYLEQLQHQDALQSLPFDRWDEVLRAAAQWGLVTADAHLVGLLRLQPTLPYFLRQRLSSMPEQRTAIETAFREHCRGYVCALAASQISRDPDERMLARFLALGEFENFYRALREALQAQESIRLLYGWLVSHLEQSQEHERGRALSDEVVAGMSRYPETLLRGALGSDHVMAMTEQASRLRKNRQYVAAEDAYQQALRAVETLNDLPAHERGDLTASIYHELGLSAEEQRQWPQAEAHYRKGLEINTEFGGHRSEAPFYHQLGRIAREQREWQQAEEHFRKAVAINAERHEVRAETYHELGILAQDQRQWAQAEAHYRRALQIKIEFNDGYGQASTHYQLGQVAHQQQQLSQAEAHFRQALEIEIEFDVGHGQAYAYQSLGEVALAQGQWEQAEDHFDKAIGLLVESNDRHRLGGAYFQLGSVAKHRGELAQAEAHYRQALEIFIEFNDRLRQVDSHRLLGVVAHKQRQWPQAEGHYVQALEIALELNDRREQANLCHLLGAIAHEQRQWPQAEEYGLYALALFVECEEKSGIYASLHTMACVWLQTQDAGLLSTVAQLTGGTAEETAEAFKNMLEWGGTTVVSGL